MSENDNLTIDRIAKLERDVAQQRHIVERLADATVSGYDATDAQTQAQSALAQILVNNQANLSRQFEEDRTASRLRFDTLEAKLNQIHKTLYSKENGDPVLVRLDNHDKDKAERDRHTAARKDVGWKIVTAICIAILLGMGSIVLQAFRNQSQPQPVPVQGVSDDDRRQIVDDVVKALQEQKSKQEESEQEESERQRNANKRRSRRVSQSRSMLADTYAKSRFSGWLPPHTSKPR